MPRASAISMVTKAHGKKKQSLARSLIQMHQGGAESAVGLEINLVLHIRMHSDPTESEVALKNPRLCRRPVISVAAAVLALALIVGVLATNMGRSPALSPELVGRIRVKAAAELGGRMARSRRRMERVSKRAIVIFELLTHRVVLAALVLASRDSRSFPSGEGDQRSWTTRTNVGRRNRPTSTFAVDSV